MQENVGSSVADDVSVLLWARWSKLTSVWFYFISFLLWNNKVKRSFSCRSSAKKVFKRLCCHLLQHLFFLVFSLPQALWFDAKFPKLLVILFSNLNSCQFSYETNTATWCKDGYLCLWLPGEFCEFCPACTSSLVFRKPENKNAFVARNEHGNNLCWRCFACTLMGKELLIS